MADRVIVAPARERAERRQSAQPVDPLVTALGRPGRTVGAVVKDDEGPDQKLPARGASASASSGETEIDS